MNRELFKLRMKSLKSYRENNPGKGYWDWKVEAFLPGGETDNNTPIWLELSYLGPVYLPKKLSTPEIRDTGIAYQDNARVGLATLSQRLIYNVELHNDLSFGPLGFLPVVGDVEEVANIALDVAEGNYGLAAAGLGLLAIPGGAAGKLFRKFKKSRLRIEPNFNQSTTTFLMPSIVDPAIDLRTEQLQERLTQIRNFRNRIASIPPEQLTDELYEQFKLEFLNLSTNIPRMNDSSLWPIVYNTELIEQDIFDRGFQYQADMLERQAAAEREIRRLSFNELLSNVLKNLIINLPDLIRSEPYNVNNLPEDFINSKGFYSDIKNAVYFNMTPRLAVQEATLDFNNLKHGLAWNLNHNDAVSTDSYPLQLSLMNKYKDQGMIKVFKDDSGNVEMMRLNTYGRLTGNKALSRINLKLKIISDITGDKDLEATINAEGDILVPKILYRKYKEGGEVPLEDRGLFLRRELGDSPYDDPRIEDRFKPRFELRKEPVSYYSNLFTKVAKLLRPINILGTVGEFILNVFPSKEQEYLNNVDTYFDKQARSKRTISTEKLDKGGEVPPDNSPVRVNPFTGKPLANGAITPVLDLEGAANFTPAGDILSIRDAYIAALNRDLLGLGLAGLGVLPIVPNLGKVFRRSSNDAFDTVLLRLLRDRMVKEEARRLNRDVIESMIENEDAFRRAANADRTSGTNYISTYSNMIRSNPTNFDYDSALRNTDTKAQVRVNNPNTIMLNPNYYLENTDPMFKQLNTGLVRHEMGHGVDIQAGRLYTDKLADPNKFVDDNKLKEMFPKRADRLRKEVLNRGSEIKSYMNEFRDKLIKEGRYEPKETLKGFREKLDLYGEDYPTLRMIFDSYRSKKLFIKDYNNVPITATNKQEELV